MTEKQKAEITALAKRRHAIKERLRAVASNHIVDSPEAREEEEIANALANSELWEIDLAIARIENGTYAQPPS